jgi:hypothetical protein
MTDVVLSGEGSPVPASGPRLVPMKVGDAVLYVEATGGTRTIEESEEAIAVGMSPSEAFETASAALQECVRVVGERLQSIGAAVQPQEVGVEFNLTFDVEGRATIIPVLLTGKATSGIGIKVTAKWQPGHSGT